ncbi:MAG: DNA-3-methyladenine glycosylase 2 family protein [Deltaproteobacteria bacterium]|nr:DNA-3-methyladenine glycosylase 2 family protein [Deltaproteobacteria bacterium]
MTASTKAPVAGPAPRLPAHARRTLTRADPTLGRHIARVGKYSLVVRPPVSLFAALAEAIVYQQLTAKAAATIHARVAALGITGFPTPAEVIALQESRLRGAGLSTSKARALLELADQHERGALPTVDECRRLADDEVIDRLTVVRGIGPWTVQMFLMFRLGRPDVLPATDYGVQKGFQRVFRTKALPTPQQVLARGERWRPFRTVAVWSLWRALELPPPARRRPAAPAG